MKNTLRNLSAVFLFLLSACSTSNQQKATLTVDVIPTIVSTKTPTETANIALATATEIIQIPAKDNSALLSNPLPNCGDVELSPNQAWAAGICNNDETWIVAVDQTAKWTISYGEYYGNKFDSGNGFIAPFYWTPDNKYLYLTIQRGVSGPVYFANGWGLLSLDLTNGNITEILSPLPHQYYAFSLSPDGKSLAYILQRSKPLKVNISTLEGNNRKSHVLISEYNQAGEILWSPDMSKIVLGQAIVDYDGTKPDVFSVVMINLADDSREILVSDNSVQMSPEKWIDENTVELFASDGKVWIFDFRNKTLSEKTQ